MNTLLSIFYFTFLRFCISISKYLIDQTNKWIIKPVLGISNFILLYEMTLRDSIGL